MYVKKSAEKLAKDECYPVGVTQQFLSFQVLVEDINLYYKFFLPTVNSFAGDNWKLYPKCYRVCGEAKELKNLDHNCSMILRFEVVNKYLTGATIRGDVLSFDDANSKCLSEKEIAMISYLSGYIFGTFYRRIRFSKFVFFGSVHYQQCLRFLMVGKCNGESIPIVISEHRHVQLLDGGCLWRVISDVTSIFKVGECYYKCAI